MHNIWRGMCLEYCFNIHVYLVSRLVTISKTCKGETSNQSHLMTRALEITYTCTCTAVWCRGKCLYRLVETAVEQGFMFKDPNSALAAYTKLLYYHRRTSRGGGRGGLQPPQSLGNSDFFGQQEKIWAKPGFKDVSMFF